MPIIYIMLTLCTNDKKLSIHNDRYSQAPKIEASFSLPCNTHVSPDKFKLREGIIQVNEGY